MRKFFAVVVALSLFGVSVHAASPPTPTLTTPPSSASGTALENKVVEHTLKNGMRLLMVERHTSPTVAAWIRFRVGSVDEKSDERGIAHLLEHMLFKGTTTLGSTDYAAEKPILDRIEQTGQSLIAEKAKRERSDAARVAELARQLKELETEAGKYVSRTNFSSSTQRMAGLDITLLPVVTATTYLISLPSNKLELWAAIESDRMQNAVLREFYTERAVVMEERRRSYDSDPENKLWETFLASSYQAHPYGQPTIGWMSDIENLTRSKAERFFMTITAHKARSWQLSATLTPPRPLPLWSAISAPSPPEKNRLRSRPRNRIRLVSGRIEVIAESEPTLMIGFHKPSIPAPDDYVFDVISTIIGHGRTSRLYRKLVIETQIATEVDVFDAPEAAIPIC